MNKLSNSTILPLTACSPYSPARVISESLGYIRAVDVQSNRTLDYTDKNAATTFSRTSNNVVFPESKESYVIGLPGVEVVVNLNSASPTEFQRKFNEEIRQLVIDRFEDATKGTARVVTNMIGATAIASDQGDLEVISKFASLCEKDDSSMLVIVSSNTLYIIKVKSDESGHVMPEVYYIYKHSERLHVGSEFAISRDRLAVKYETSVACGTKEMSYEQFENEFLSESRSILNCGDLAPTRS